MEIQKEVRGYGLLGPVSQGICGTRGSPWIASGLKDRRIVSLDVSALVAGAKFRGDFEERLQAVLAEVKDAEGEVVLFIDEMHTMVKAGGGEGSMDAGNMLKPMLARGELRCIGSLELYCSVS